MTVVRASESPAYHSAALRQDLCLRNAAYAKVRNLVHVLSYGECPVVVYERFPDEERHGNFLTTSYRAILAQPSWRRRLEKIHTQASRSLPKSDKGWMELDSCTSSDALLMNIFCHPSTFRGSKIRTVLAHAGEDLPEFGIKARVPFIDGATDRTEIDMEWGGVLFESKLTETDFQSSPAAVVERYRDLAVVFEVSALPRSNDKFLSYQLIRNVLAAQALGRHFCVLIDARRPDLREACFQIFRAVREAQLRTKCKVFTWQELFVFLSPELRCFLNEKYGIMPPREYVSSLVAGGDVE